MTAKVELLRLEERISIGIDAGESQFREFKSALTRDAHGKISPRNVKDICKDIGDTLVAFANADGGELLIGVEDDGKITGIPHKEALTKTMHNAYKNNIHQDTPLPLPIIADKDIYGKKIMYISTSKSLDSVHLTSDGRCLKRIDRENRPVAAEHIQASRDEYLSREYDRIFVDGATTGDLDLDLVYKVGQQVALGYSAEKVLQYLGLAEYGVTGIKYKRAALLLFAKDISRWHPRCVIRIVRVKGTELGVGAEYNVVQDDYIGENIVILIDKAWESLRPHLARTRFQSTGLFKESLIYPELACRESLVNAIAHRDYSREGSPIEVLVFDDRMEFKSPGSLLSTISLEELKKFRRSHDSRNVMISRCLRELGYMREMGEGIPRIFKAMRDSELVDPELIAERDSFLVTLRHKSIFTQQDLDWLEGYKEFDLNKNEQRVILLGKDGHPLSTNEIIKVAGIIDIDQFRALYDVLRAKGLIYSIKGRSSIKSASRRDIGRFMVRPPRDVEKYFGELIVGMRGVGPALSLSLEIIKKLKSSIQPDNPYYDRPDWSLQNIGFIDGHKRFLPKAIGYVPELGMRGKDIAKKITGTIISVKPAKYGFIKTDDGTDYFFHHSGLELPLTWDNISAGQKVSFKIKPKIGSDLRDIAGDISLLK